MAFGRLVGAGAGALLGHGDVETAPVDLDRPFGCDLLGDLEREPIGVVEDEGDVAGQRLALGQLREMTIEQGRTGAQRLAEPAFLSFDRGPDLFVVADELGVGLAHDGDHRVDEAGHDDLVDAEEVGVADRSAQDPAQHVAALLRSRDTMFSAETQERESPARDPRPRSCASRVGSSRSYSMLESSCKPVRLRSAAEQETVWKLSRTPHRVDAMEDGQCPLQSQAPVSIPGCGEWRPSVPSGCMVELREHQVPELDVAIAITAVGRAARRASTARVPHPNRSTDLRARTAGPRLPGHDPRSCLPCRDELDAVGGREPTTDTLPQLAPPRRRSWYTEIHKRSRDRGRAPRVEELPGPLDGFGLEVIAEAEVAEHLEEGEVTARAADLVEVVVLAAGPHALLDGRRPAVGRLLVTDEVGLERHHARVGEQQGVVREGSGSPIPRGCGRARRRMR